MSTYFWAFHLLKEKELFDKYMDKLPDNYRSKYKSWTLGPHLKINKH